jgi:hypothetical protein
MSPSVQTDTVAASREAVEHSRTQRGPHSTGDIATPTMKVVNPERPIVRKTWLIAMAIVFVALLALVLLVARTP